MNYKANFGERVHYTDAKCNFYGTIVKSGDDLIDLLLDSGTIIEKLDANNIKKMRNNKAKSSIRNCGLHPRRKRNYSLYGELKMQFLFDLNELLSKADGFVKGTEINLEDICKIRKLSAETLEFIFKQDKYFKKKVYKAILTLNNILSQDKAEDNVINKINIKNIDLLREAVTNTVQ